MCMRGLVHVDLIAEALLTLLKQMAWSRKIYKLIFSLTSRQNWLVSYVFILLPPGLCTRTRGLVHARTHTHARTESLIHSLMTGPTCWVYIILRMYKIHLFSSMSTEYKLLIEVAESPRQSKIANKNCPAKVLLNHFLHTCTSIIFLPSESCEMRIHMNFEGQKDPSIKTFSKYNSNVNFSDIFMHFWTSMCTCTCY